MVSRIARITSLPGLLLLVNVAAWAGRGDVDPNYGEGGRVSAPQGALLALPGDRLAIGEATGKGFRVRMVDATGQNVPAFGEGGVVLIDSSAAARTFQPEAAALAPNGDMIFVGSLSDTGARELLRLDSDGQPVPSFGNRGDGFAEPTVVSARALAFAVDPAGKIVLAEGSWNPDSSCDSTARLQRLLANGQQDAEFSGDGLIEIPNLDFCNGAPVFGARANGGVIVGDGQSIVAVDAAGDIDPTFGVDGRLAVSELPNVRGLLLPDGSLLIVGSDTLTGSSNTVLLKFDRNGQPDLDFGAGTGSVTVDLGAPLGEPSAREHVEQLALDPDGEYVVAGLSLTVSGGNGYGRVLCSGIARLTIDGTPDTGFGRDGVTCLNLAFALIGVQSDGAPLFIARVDDSIHRLLPDSSPSPGFLRVVGAYGSNFLSESGTATVATIERLAGRDGAVSVDYATVDPTELGYPATAGSDYMATSERLDWASGDDSPRAVTVSILDDDIDEPNEIFGVDLSEPGGGVQLIGASMSAVISDDDEASSTPPPLPPPPAAGGGGSVSWATPLALLALLFIRRRRVRRVAGLIAIQALMLLAPVAIAGPGDLDPAYADVGRLGPIAGLQGTAWSLELLQDGSSLISGGDLDGGCSTHDPRSCRLIATNFVDRVDAEGALDESWNAAVLEGTEVLDAVMQPDGKLLAVGREVERVSPFQTRLVAFRLESDGSLDPGFGSAGIVELATESYPGRHQGQSVALEPDGRIVIAGALDGELFVLRLLADGGLDNSFGNAGAYHDTVAAHGAAQRIVRAAAGGYRIMTAGASCRVVALTEAGAIDGAYGASGIVNLESSPGEPIACGSLASQADGRLLVAGSMSAAGVVIRLLDSGAPDPSFAADAAVTSVLTEATAVAAGADGTVLLGGSSIQGAAIMRLQTDGTLDALFGNGGVTELDLPSESGSLPSIRDLVAGADGKVLAAGGELHSDLSFAVRLLGNAGGESAGVLGVSQPFVDASEEDLEAVVTVRRTGGSDGSVSVAYQTAAGSATADEDFQSVTGILTWADGASDEKQIVVPIAIAGSPEELEDFRVTLHDVQGGAGLGTKSGTVTILADGSPAGQFGIPDGYEANELDMIEAFIYRNYYCAGEVSVTVTPTSGTATVGEDFDSQPTVLTWGDQDCEPKRVLIQIHNDGAEEEAETFSLELSNATGGAIIGPYSVAAYSITRNDFEVATDTGRGGGGGSVSWATPLALLNLLFMRRRRVNRN